MYSKLPKTDRYKKETSKDYESFYDIPWDYPKLSKSKVFHTCGSQFYKERTPSNIIIGINMMMQLINFKDVSWRAIGSVN